MPLTPEIGLTEHASPKPNKVPETVFDCLQVNAATSHEAEATGHGRKFELWKKTVCQNLGPHFAQTSDITGRFVFWNCTGRNWPEWVFRYWNSFCNPFQANRNRPKSASTSRLSTAAADPPKSPCCHCRCHEMDPKKFFFPILLLLLLQTRSENRGWRFWRIETDQFYYWPESYCKYR